MKYVDAVYGPSCNSELKRALGMADGLASVTDEHGNPISAVKLFEETLTDGSKVSRLQIYFEAVS